MKIYRGTQHGRPVTWIEPRTTWQFELTDLINGLCSHYVRCWTADDDDWPAHLTADEVVLTAKQEHERYGTNSVWAWSDHTDPEIVKEGEAWARLLILRVLPGLKEDPS